MKLGLLQNLYPNYTRSFESRYTNEATTYSEAINYLDSDCFGWNGVWTDPLAKKGIQLFELFINLDLVNKLWANENGLDFGTLPVRKLLIHQIQKFQIDVLIITDVSILGSEFVKQVRAETNVKLIYAHICSPYYSLVNIKEYDGIFTCLKSQQREFVSYGLPSFYLPHAFSDKVISDVSRDSLTKKEPIVFFAGGVIKGKDLHDDREKLLLSFIENDLPLRFYSELHGYNTLKETTKLGAKQLVFSIIKLLKALGINESAIDKIPVIRKGISWTNVSSKLVDDIIIKKALPPIYGLELYKKISSSLVSLNIHAGIVNNEAANMRLFEATALSSCLLTDHKANLVDFFEEDKEIIAYQSIEEAFEKARYLINNPGEAIAIGKAAQQRVIKDHTFNNRSEILMEVINNNIK